MLGLCWRKLGFRGFLDANVYLHLEVRSQKMAPGLASLRPGKEAAWRQKKSGNHWQLVCLCSARIPLKTKNVFRLGESVILRFRKARKRPRWSYVGTKLAHAGPGLDPCCLMLAQVGCKVAHVGQCRLPDANRQWLYWPYWAYVGRSRAPSEAILGSDRRRSGQDGSLWQLVCLCSARIPLSKKTRFA